MATTFTCRHYPALSIDGLKFVGGRLTVNGKAEADAVADFADRYPRYQIEKEKARRAKAPDEPAPAAPEA